jgi:FixJ family two-component response regulator
MNQGEATVLVVEEDSTVRLSLEQLLRFAGYVVEVFSSAERFLRKSSGDGIGCVLLDFYMSGYPGLELLNRLNASGFSLPIIFLSRTPSVRTVVQAMKYGAADFLLKPLDGELVLLAVQEAIEKSRSIYKTKCETQAIQGLAASLTLRENQVFHEVTAGYLNKQIAESLGVAEKTIKVHRGRVMKKMKACSIVDLVLLAEKLKYAKHQYRGTQTQQTEAKGTESP